VSAADTVRVIVATANKGKLEEIRSALGGTGWEFVTAADLGRDALEVEETGETFEDNARLKAWAYHDEFGLPALADDSGLEVDVLGGEPGVYSSRYAGPDATDSDNNRKLLAALDLVPAGQRQARFRSVIVFIDADGVESVAAGACEGSIGFEPYGTGGFGYDPLFLPSAAPGRTMAELAMGEKNEISHRGAALRALAAVLGR
jgi:XTP/dITP diphosphohydrolase